MDTRRPPLPDQGIRRLRRGYRKAGMFTPREAVAFLLLKLWQQGSGPWAVTKLDGKFYYSSF